MKMKKKTRGMRTVQSMMLPKIPSKIKRMPKNATLSKKIGESKEF
jgi:hypothetical protein